ncbi:MBL fold metallo-hydrolase [Paenibacillus validus]|uniref:MBL fold metallo-hydrolase n=1 Tax=Paenibacillus TaxID=44249 RepID=UPI000FD729BF|nr:MULTISPECIES: MBL fold metallo-hydrolase [Paenibacillus]MED4601895.1 MBL fold metallo-hydrolase [Paenibacillus validus]MED4606423.1 MBL fold metallo-hydrolase [Paenibacillus validus]
MLIPVASHIDKVVIAFPQGGDVNCYLLKGESGYTLVDTGIHSESAIQQWENVLANGLTIDKVVLTHTHPDHIGLAGWFQKRLGVPVIMSRIGYETMRKAYELWLAYADGENEPYRFLLKHGGPAVPYKRMLKQASAGFMEPDGLFENGEEIRLGDGMYEALWTPGHAFDHYCFYDRENGRLLAGDHVLGDISPVITLWSDDGGNPLEDYFRSLEQIEKISAELVLPGHGGLISDLKQRVSEIRDGHHVRMRQIIDILGEEEMTAGEVSRIVYNNQDDNARFMMEIQSSLARLTYLESRGEVSSRLQDGKVLFGIARS